MSPSRCRRLHVAVTPFPPSVHLTPSPIHPFPSSYQATSPSPTRLTSPLPSESGPSYVRYIRRWSFIRTASIGSPPSPESPTRSTRTANRNETNGPSGSSGRSNSQSKCRSPVRNVCSSTTVRAMAQRTRDRSPTPPLHSGIADRRPLMPMLIASCPFLSLGARGARPNPNLSESDPCVRPLASTSSLRSAC